jgi:hypothetical protein
MTELARQIEAHRSAHISSKPTSIGRASLFLTAKEAAGLDFEEVYDACMSGISTLVQYEPRFNNWNETILHPSSTSAQRELKSKDENKTINKQLNSLIRLLALYGTEQAAHKVFEYLLQRYRINELNVDAILSSMLFMHDTKIYARLVQLSTIVGTSWEFLMFMKTTGMPMERSQLVKRLQKGDASLLTILATNLASTIKLAGHKHGSKTSTSTSTTVTGGDRFLSFYTALMLEWLESCPPLTEEQLRVTIPSLLDGLKAHENVTHKEVAAASSHVYLCRQWRRSVCMIVAQLTRSRTGPQLAKTLYRSLLNALVSVFLAVSTEVLQVSTAGNGGGEDLHSEALEVVMTIAILEQELHGAYGKSASRLDSNILRNMFSSNYELWRNSSQGQDGNVMMEMEETGIDGDRRGSIFPTLDLNDKSQQEDCEVEEYTARNLPPFLVSLAALHTSFEGGTESLITSVCLSLTNALLLAVFTPSDAPIQLTPQKISLIMHSLIVREMISTQCICTLIDMLLRAGGMYGDVDGNGIDTSKSKKNSKKNKTNTNDNTNSSSQANVKHLYKVIHTLVQRHSTLFDVAVDKSLQEFDVETQGKLRQFLNSAFVDAPFRAPIAEGTSLLLSLQHPSHNVRISALEALVRRVPMKDDNDDDEGATRSDSDDDDAVARAARLNAKAVKEVAFVVATAAGVSPPKPEKEIPVSEVPHSNRREVSADLLGVIDAASRLLLDTDSEVAQAAWVPGVVNRVCAYSDPDDFSQIVVDAVVFWRQHKSLNPTLADAVITSILKCITEDDIVKTMVASRRLIQVSTNLDTNCKATWKTVDWLYCSLVGLSTENSVTDEVQKVAFDCACSVATYLPLLSPLNVHNTKVKSKTALKKGTETVMSILAGHAVSALAADDGSMLSITRASLASNSLRSICTASKSIFVSSLEVVPGRNTTAFSVDVATAWQCLCLVHEVVSQLFDEDDSAEALRSCLPSYFSLTLAAAQVRGHTTEVSEMLRTSLLGVEKHCPYGVGDAPEANVATVSDYLLFTPMPEDKDEAAGSESDEDHSPEYLNQWGRKVGHNVLTEILAARQEELASLAGPTLSAFFNRNPALALISSYLGSSNSDHHSHANSSIISRSRAGALLTLAAYSTSVPQLPLPLLLCLSFFAITATCDNAKIVRQSAISLLEKLQIERSTSNTTVTNSKSDDMLLSLNSKSLCEINLSLNDHLKAIASISTNIIRSKSTVVADCEAAKAVLSRLLVNTPSNNHMTTASAQLLYVAGHGAASSTVRSARQAVVILSCAAGAPLDGVISLWNVLHFVSEFISNDDSIVIDDRSDVASAIIKCLDTDATGQSTVKTKQDIFEWVRAVVSNNNNRETDSFDSLRSGLLRLLARGWKGMMESNTVDQVLKQEMYLTLLLEQQLRPGRAEVLQALTALQVSPVVIENPISELVNKFTGVYNEFTSSEDPTLLGGVAVPLQHLVSILEAIIPMLQNMTVGNSTFSKKDIQALSSVNSLLLSALALTCDSRLGAVLSIEYVRSLVMDASAACMTSADAGGESLFLTKTPAGMSEHYSSKRVLSDVKTVLSCLGTCGTSHAQRAALVLLQCLLKIGNDECVPEAVKAVGALLASTAVGSGLSSGNDTSDVGSNGVLGAVLNTLIEVTGASQPQLVLQPLCENLQKVPAPRRGYLVRMAMRALGPQALSASVGILLLHALVAYETSLEQATTNNVKAVAQDHNSTKGKEGEFILLSRAAERKSKRLLSASPSEDLYRLASDITLSQPANIQMENLVNTAHATQMHLLLLSGSNSIDAEKSISMDVDDEEKTELSTHTIDVDELHSYRAILKGQEDENYTSAAALILLNLEYLYDMVESRQFHRSLVQLIDSEGKNDSDNGNAQVHSQELFLRLFDKLLQLIGMSSSMYNTDDRDNDDIVDASVGPDTMQLSMSSFVSTVHTWCLDILTSLHRLLDAASFVSIMQELIEHEQASVRKTALQILSQRLERIGGSSGGSEEKLLLLDMAGQLHRSVVEVIGYDSSTNELALFTMDDDEKQSNSELAQSALVCLDTLVFTLGNDANWSKTLLSFLKFGPEICTVILSSYQNSEQKSNFKKKVQQPTNMQLQQNELKLLANMMLCCSTVVHADSVSAKALSILSKLMSCFLGTLESVRETCLKIAESGDEHDVSETNTLALLARAALASITKMVKALPKYFHPYMERTLSACLGLDVPLGSSTSSINGAVLTYGMSHSEILTLSSEVDLCLTTVGLSIPARLAVPILTKCVPTQLQRGHTTALRTVKFLKDTWSQLDRDAIMEHSQDIEEVAAYLLDYRRVLGGNGDAKEAETVEINVSDAIVGLSLKLTEVELRKMLTRFAEWRDSKEILNGNNSKTDVVTKSKKSKSSKNKAIDSSELTNAESLLNLGQFSRRVSFYRLLQTLGNKLQSLFTPCIVPFWNNCIETLMTMETIKGHVNKLKKGKDNGYDSNDSNSDNDSDSDDDILRSSKSKSNIAKKRKRKHSSNEMPTAEQSSHAKEAAELIEVSRSVLTSVRIACTHNASNIIDEERYNTMMPAVTTLVTSSQHLFAIIYSDDNKDSEYVKFVTEYVAPCLASLALCVGRDMLWKPLTHKVLMCMRERASIIRLAAVKTLYKLFVEVGDEFLILLPECLPFLSELLEDSSADVVDNTNNCIRYIEELSGEKLDDYLK